jgi:hypothetical protein
VRQLLDGSLSAPTATTVRIRFPETAGRVVCQISVAAAGKPVFAQPSKGGNDATDFWVRVGNATKQFHGDDLVRYQEEHWGEKQSFPGVVSAPGNGSDDFSACPCAQFGPGDPELPVRETDQAGRVEATRRGPFVERCFGDPEIRGHLVGVQQFVVVVDRANLGSDCHAGGPSEDPAVVSQLRPPFAANFL